MVTAYVLFLLAGLGFGYAAPAKAKLVPLLFPLVLALGAFTRDGVDGESLVRLILALVITLIGIGVGGVLDERAASRGTASTA